MAVAPLIVLLLAQVAEPEPVVLTGTVIGIDGKPTAGAEIVLTDDAAPLIIAEGVARAAFPNAAVLRTGKTGAEGGFRVELPGHGETWLPRWKRPVFLWAFGPGGAMALRPIAEGRSADGEPIRLALARPELVRLRVLDPAGRPAAGVRVAPARVRGVNWPAELAGRLAVATDADGRASPAIGLADEIDAIRVTSGPYGIQQLRMPRADAAGVRTLQLLPVGRVAGRIEAGDVQAVRGLTLRVWTDPDPSDFCGLATVVTDDQGRFVIPAIATGTLALAIEHRWDLPWRGRLGGEPQVRPARPPRSRSRSCGPGSSRASCRMPPAAGRSPARASRCTGTSTFP